MPYRYIARLRWQATVLGVHVCLTTVKRPGWPPYPTLHVGRSLEVTIFES